MKSHMMWSLGVCLVPLSGCGAGVFSSTPGYDQQACVEEALRQRPDHALAETATAEFQLGCRAGDVAACSALGVVSEVGFGRPQNLMEARTLYLRACTGKNQRGCVNFAKLELRTASAPLSVAHAREMLLTACELGEPSGCAAMARLMAKGDGVPRDLTRANQMLKKGCDGGSAEACYSLGDLTSDPVGGSSRAALELFVKSCVAGYQPACRRLEAAPVRVATR